MGKPMPMMYGEPGATPSMEDFCIAFSTFVQNEVNKGKNPRTVLQTPTVWKKKEKAVYKVEMCPLSGSWYWSKVAVCSCNN